jgi:signal transduction histidine kinase
VRARRGSGGAFEVLRGRTGPGLAAGVLERVFEPFYQVDASPTRSHGGTGVGLAIARGIIEGHGGMARAESPSPVVIAGRALGGAAFHLLFPARPSSSASVVIAGR